MVQFGVKGWRCRLRGCSLRLRGGGCGDWFEAKECRWRLRGCILGLRGEGEV